MDEPRTSKRRAPRRDAQARREALITAAAASFASDGYGVALETIADRAGVGRGTLYRNFRDRAALALAIFSREVDRFASLIDPAASIETNLSTLVREGATAVTLFARIAVELHADNPNLTEFRALGQRLEGAVAPWLAAAQARGEVDRAIVPEDLVRAIRMGGGALHPFMPAPEVERQIAASVRLLRDGLRSRG